MVNKEIQDGINKRFLAEMDRETAIEEQKAQKIRNETAEQKAASARRQAEEFAKAQEAQVAKLEIMIEQTKAEALKISAEQGLKIVPDVVTNDSGFLINLNGSSKNKGK